MTAQFRLTQPAIQDIEQIADYIASKSGLDRADRFLDLDECAAAYRKFCQKYRPQPKAEKKSHWGSRLLAGLKVKGKPKKSSRGQLCLPWAQWDVPNEEVRSVAEKFVLANCFDPKFADIPFP